MFLDLDCSEHRRKRIERNKTRRDRATGAGGLRQHRQEHQHKTGEQLGAVHFATSCNDVAQKDINRSVALFHSFQFSRAKVAMVVMLAL